MKVVLLVFFGTLVPTADAFFTRGATEQDNKQGGRDLGSACTNTCESNPCVTGASKLYHSHCDPSKFIQCDAAGGCSTVQCPPGTVWNDSIETCDISGECAECPSPCDSGVAGDYPHCSDEAKFIQCTAQGSCYVRSCPSGTEYNDASNACDIVSSVSSQPPTPQPMPTSAPPPSSPSTPSPVKPTAASSVDLLSYQAIPGVCTAISYIGCAETDGSSGNPSDLVNCFVAPYKPFDVTHVNFWLNTNDGLPLPSSLSVRVWRGTVADGPSGVELDQSLEAGSFASGPNNVALTSPVTMNDDEFCVGVKGTDVNDGFRLDAESFDGDGSFLLAPTCGVDPFASLQSVGDFVFCVEATVEPSV